MTNSSKQPRIGDVFLMKFEGSGSEQQGWRPGVVFQNNQGNIFSPNIIALPITSSIKKTGQPTHVILRASQTGLKCDSMVLCENPERMSKTKLGKYITTLPYEVMTQIAAAELLATAGIAFIDHKTLLELKKKAISLNATTVA